MTTETSRGERALRELRPVRVFHPMLLALIPLWGTYAHDRNAGLLPLSALARPTAVLICCAIGLWVLFSAIRKDRYHGGLLASALVVPLLVVWGVLEEAIRAVIPLYESTSRVSFYVALAVAALAAICVTAYRLRADKSALRNALTFIAVLLLVSLAVATFILAPVFGRRAAWLMTGYVVATALGFRAVWNYRGDFQAATKSLNWFATVLLVLYSAVLAVNRPTQSTVTPPKLSIGEAAKAIPADELPDIYLIALDGYARADVLRTAYAYNNLPFEQEMKGLGFRFAERSTANYPQSILSLAALLNADYIENLPDPAKRGDASMADVFAYYHNNGVFDGLRSLGYRIESFSPGLESLESRRKDVVRREPEGAIGEFEMVLLDRTFLSRIMQGYYFVRYKNPAYWRYAFRRARIVYAFDEMARMAKDENAPPRFVFANMLIPEQPYLFTRDGGRAQPYGPGSLGGDRRFRGLVSDYREAYLGQVHYTNDRLIEVARQIVESSKRPAVIIVTSGRGAPPALETGPESEEERFKNLLAIRFPDGPGATVDGWRDDLSLVNVFRLVLNHTMKAQLPILEDRTLVPKEDKPFESEPAQS